MKLFIYLFILVHLIVLYSCTDDISGSTGEIITTISLYGKILDDKNNGVPNAVVKLTKLGFSDTTNSEGVYSVFIPEDTLQKYNIDLNTVNDSVEYMKGNSVLTTIQVESWIDTLPDVYIMQRNVLGKLNTTYTEFKRIEAVIKNNSDSTASVKSVDLWLSSNTFNYSGYVYTINAVGVLEYSLYVNVYDKDSLLVGRSATEIFPSTAGDIVLGEFDPFNALPNVNTGKDFTVSINDAIKLYGIVVDSFGGVATKWEWDVGNTGVFVPTTPYGCHVVTAPSIADSSFECILRVTDNDNNIVSDTVIINVVLDIPICSVSTTTPVVSINDTIRLFGIATDIYGTIDKWEWDDGNTGVFIESSSDYNAIAPSLSDSSYPLVLRVTDNDGNVVLDTIVINVVLDVPICSVSTTTPVVSINDTIRLFGIATDIYGTIDKWEWKINGGNWNEASTSDTSIIVTSMQHYNCSLRVTDDDGLSNISGIKIFLKEHYKNMVRILAAGKKFSMGAQYNINEYINVPAVPVHEVSFIYDYWMDSTEVTQGDYSYLMSLFYEGYTNPLFGSGGHKSGISGVGSTYPANKITWYDAILYCNARSKRDGKDTLYSYSQIIGIPGNGCSITGLVIDMNKDGYRLPTEAEWEYAYRGGTSTDFHWGNRIILGQPIYHLYENVSLPYYISYNGPNRVALLLPNTFGLYDMGGNYAEWCNDWYCSYTNHSLIDPIGPEVGEEKVIRGCGWMGNWFGYEYDSPKQLLSGYRNKVTPTSRDEGVGFRVVLQIR